MKTVVFVGRLSFNDSPCAGEVKKNQLLFARLSKFSDIKVIPLDTIRCKGRVAMAIMLLRICFSSRFGKRKIILSTYDGSAYIYLRFLTRLHLQKSIIYWVIGGGLGKKVKTDEYSKRYFEKLHMIIVEDIDMETLLNECGLTNVMTLTNFKPIYKLPNKIIMGKTNYFVFLSRITPLKGCDIIISAVKMLNRKGVDFQVDFWGPIEDGYNFTEYIEEVPNISYKGIMSLTSQDDYTELSQYDIMLFPTFYPNEGFPGSIIDGFMVGLPIVATNWRYNRHIIDDSVNGWLLPIQDSGALANIMQDIIEGKYDIQSMSLNCQEKVGNYDVAHVVSQELLYKIGII